MCVILKIFNLLIDIFGKVLFLKEYFENTIFKKNSLIHGAPLRKLSNINRYSTLSF